jgi:hypothetical protein
MLVWSLLLLCVWKRKKKKKRLLSVRHFSSELSIVFISFLKFTRRELHFLVTSSLFASGYLCRYLSNKISYASFFLTVAIFLGYHPKRQAVISRPGCIREHILSLHFLMSHLRHWLFRCSLLGSSQRTEWIARCCRYCTAYFKRFLIDAIHCTTF